MNGNRAIVLAGGGLMLAFIATTPGPKYKRAWAAGVTVLGLSLLADIAPNVAGPATVLVLLALAYRSRSNLVQVLTGKTASAASGKPSGTGPGTTQGKAQNVAHSTGPLPNPLSGQ